MKLNKYLKTGALLAGVIWTAAALKQDGRAEENKAAITYEENGETEQTIYGIGSISKIFPAVAVMQLAEQGKLELDTPVYEYIPEFQMADERYREITPRMLLDHSSGLMGTSDYNAMLLGECDSTPHDTFLDRIRVQRLKADPGAFSVYSNDGFTLAEILVEKVSGMSFTEYIRQNITDKLGMEDTKTPAVRFDRSRQAKIYYNNTNIELPAEYLYEIGAGGILSTAEDMCRFGQIFTRQGTKVLTDQSVLEMETAQTNHPFLDFEGTGRGEYGLGWDTVCAYPFAEYGLKAVTKGGDTSSYHANLTVLPEENMSAAVLSAGGSSSLNQLLVSEMLLEVLAEEGKIGAMPEAKQPELVQNVDLSEFEEYEGYYISQGILKIRFQDGALYISTLDNRRNVTQEYLPAEGGVFVSTNGDYISSMGELVSAEDGTRGRTVISFREGENGEKYVCAENMETHPGIGTAASAAPIGQKVQSRQLSEETAAAWRERDGKKYYLTDEKASSSGYLEPAMTVRLPKEQGAYIEGYFRNAKVVDADHAEAFVEIPLMFGRDLADYEFYNKGGKEYLNMNLGGKDKMCLKKRYICQDSMEILTERSFTFTLEESESTRWYQVPDAIVGEEAGILLPENAEFFVYDSKDRLITSSLAVNGSDTLRFPAGGKLVFVGNPGDTFTLR